MTWKYLKLYANKKFTSKRVHAILLSVYDVQYKQKIAYDDRKELVVLKGNVEEID